MNFLTVILAMIPIWLWFSWFNTISFENMQDYSQWFLYALGGLTILQFIIQDREQVLHRGRSILGIPLFFLKDVAYGWFLYGLLEPALVYYIAEYVLEPSPVSFILVFAAIALFIDETMIVAEKYNMNETQQANQNMAETINGRKNIKNRINDTDEKQFVRYIP